ncbi:zinc ribbon domain-containing protein [Mycolicibacterium sp. P9-64]|uniref:zinc ribbon domain-containing protein n=1 Tax=Mycolicibacterium sp. P9-64 TaxID=2024612 RepID=UPI0011ED6C81|nr:zinc ribbon domain-containing protein [Mycolicibacterium sp. P9-64]KAA0086626.1 zinc ribbon domain-containing protein [Mycolicibacterium sp. P9-64]
MTSADPPAGEALTTTTCQVCGTDVPVGRFCGSCGANLHAGQDSRRDRLRIGAFAAASGEHVLRPSVASSLFPQLPRRSRRPFRFGLVVVVVVLAVFAALRWQAPLIATAALGLPVLFAIYLRETDAHRDLPMRTLALTTVVGIACGAGWALVIGVIVSHSYDVAMGSEEDLGHALLEGLTIPVGGALVMLAPTVVVRLLRPSTREALDGFVIGSLAAASFTVAATVARLAPQLATGPTTQERSVGDLLVEAGMQGIAVPVMALAVGGLVGTALWLGRTRVLVASVLTVVVLYTATGLVETASIPQEVQVGLHLVVAALALLALRIGLQVALLSGEHDAPTGSPVEQVQCPQCEHAITGLAFCSNCGAAAQAASRTSRAGYAVPQGAAPVRTTTPRRVLLPVGGVLAAAAVASVVVSMVITPNLPRYVCPPDCGGPPLGSPVTTNPRFISPDGAYSFSYPGPGTAYEATVDEKGVVLNFVAGDTGTLVLFGEPAQGRTPKQITDDLIQENYPDATVDYEIPNASVGYQPGYGVIADEYPQDSTGTYTRLRLLVMVAVKNDIALVAAAAGPYHEFSPSFGTGHPSGANLQLAMDMAKYVNSFAWRGDPAR